MKLKNKFFVILTVALAFIITFSIDAKCAFNFDTDHLEDYEAYIFTFAKSDLTSRNYSFSLSEYDIEITTYDFTIKNRGTVEYNEEYNYDFLSFYIQFTYNRYDLVVVESINFKRNDPNGTREILRDYLQTPATVQDITVTLQNENFFSMILLDNTFYDDINSIRGYLVNAYNNSFNSSFDTYYNNGYNQGYTDGARVDLNDYIKKDDATSWISGIFEAFGDFFSIKIGPVSIGAIVIMPVAISLVWFLLRMFRGGGSA